MSHDLDLGHYRNLLRRRAIGFEIGGFRPPEDLSGSWFGRVNLAASGESWPEHNGKLLTALCQIDLRGLPFKPPRLEDLELLTIFVSEVDLPDNDANGSTWCLRAYDSAADLTLLPQQDMPSKIRAFPMRPRVIESDFPCWEDVDIELPRMLEDSYYDHFENIGGLKLGGWPTLIQSEIYWAPNNKHPIGPEYVLQVDSTDKGNWMWGDAGVGYFGRGTVEDLKDEWACEWQCY